MKQQGKWELTSPWIYLLATFAWTWLFWGIAIALRVSVTSAGGLLMLIGVLGPMVTGILFTYLTRDREGRRDYWRRVVDFRRIPPRWYLVTLLFVPVLNALAVWIDRLTGGPGATWGEAALSIAAAPFSILLSMLFATLIPFIEELGWRGYALDRFQERHNALVSSLILGAAWSLWHLPLFFIADTYQAGLGVGTTAFWLFLFGVLPLSLPFTWIYNNTARSTLAVILFHASVNFVGELLTLSQRAETIYVMLWFVAAIFITLGWGAATLTRRPEQPA